MKVDPKIGTDVQNLKQAEIEDARVLPALSNIEVVYVDSRAALTDAYRQGLNPHAEVRTSSPSMILDPTLTVTQSDRQIQPETVQRLYREVTGWAQEIFQTLNSSPEFAAVALVVAQRALRFQTQIFKLMVLQEDDFTRPVSSVTIETDSPTEDAKLNPPYQRVLSFNPQFMEVRVPKNSVSLVNPIAPPAPSFRDRLRFSDWQVKAYRLVSLFWNLIPMRSPFGTILIYNEGDLVKETALHLAKRGYGLQDLKAPPLPDQKTEENPAIRKIFQPFLAERLADWLAPSAVAPTVEYFISEIEFTISEFNRSLPTWRTKLASLLPLRPKAILANMVAGPAAAALGVAAREQSIVVVAFQHGVASEIADDADCAEFFHGSNTADVLFTFNPESARITNRSILSRGKAISIGMQRDHFRAAKLRSRDSSLPPIWYISTMLYVGNYQMLARGMGDLDSAEYECVVINNILSRLPHRVLYKPYPASRYTDADPINETAAACTNITLYEEAQDLRYLLENCRVIVTARPTSTIGWCLTSGKPVVYIDVPGLPLLPEAREALAAGLFLFDGSLPFDNQPLLDFLSQPIEEIERQWAERAPARQALIKKYIDGGNMDAGKKAARLLANSRFQSNLMPD